MEIWRSRSWTFWTGTWTRLRRLFPIEFWRSLPFFRNGSIAFPFVASTWFPVVVSAWFRFFWRTAFYNSRMKFWTNDFRWSLFGWWRRRRWWWCLFNYNFFRVFHPVIWIAVALLLFGNRTNVAFFFAIFVIGQDFSKFWTIRWRFTSPRLVLWACRARFPTGFTWCIFSLKSNHQNRISYKLFNILLNEISFSMCNLYWIFNLQYFFIQNLTNWTTEKNLSLPGLLLLLPF